MRDIDIARIDEIFGDKTIDVPLQQIDDPLLSPYDIQLFVKRDDLIHPYVSGNKWRKLKYNLHQAALENHDTLLTFGGAYSNHILATAHASRLCGFRSIGVIRGEEYAPLNPILAEAQSTGMTFEYMPRWRYRQKESQEIRNELQTRFGCFYMLPEGGTNKLAVRGCSEIIADISRSFDVVCCACGTGGTLAGLISGLRTGQQALGVAVLKGETFLKDSIRRLIPTSHSKHKWDISFDYSFGGYAKKNVPLLNFIDRFQTIHHIELDAVYTGKLMFGLYEMIQSGHFDRGKRIVAIHTGKTQNRHHL